MKFKCNQQTLAKALNTVSKAVSTRTTIPILKGILIEAKNGTLTLSASDLEISIKKTISADIEQEGAVVVVAKLFGDIIRKLPNENIIIEESDDGNIIMSTSASEFTVITMALDQFPAIGENTESNSNITIDANMFREMIRKTSFAASVDESKGTLVGILTELTPESIDMVALDGFRLAHTRNEMIGDRTDTFIIAGKIMNELSKITSDEVDAPVVRISLGDKRALVQVGTTEIIIRIMEGDYIRYKDIIPKDSLININVNRAQLLESIERASLLAKEGKNNLIKFSINDDLLTITSRSEEGNVKEIINIDKSGDNLEIGFNSKFIIDVLKAIDDDEVAMNFKSSITPCVITPIEGKAYEYLVLPVRIPNM